MFATSFASFAYLQSIEQLNGNGKSNNSPTANLSGSERKEYTTNLQFMVCSLVIICCIANGTMTFFQVSALQRKFEWFYFYPYMWLWIFIAFKFFTSMKAVHTVEKAHRIFASPFWVEGMLLWILTMTMQLASWHLVFVLYSINLNPFRALLYCVVIIVTLISCVVGLAVIMKFIAILIFRFIIKSKDVNLMWFKMHCPCTLKKDDNFPFIDVTLMFSLVMLLIYIFTYSAFILQTSINSNQLPLYELTKWIIPKLFLLVTAWLSTRLFLTPEKIWKFRK